MDLNYLKKVILGFTILTANFMSSGQVVYLTNSYHSAQIKVYVVDNAFKADLSVYKVNSQYEAGGNRGRWFFTDYEFEAKKSIFFVRYSHEADLNIFYVKENFAAGWRNETKRYLLE